MISGTVFSMGSDLGFYFLVFFGLFWAILGVIGLIVVFDDFIHPDHHLKH